MVWRDSVVQAQVTGGVRSCSELVVGALFIAAILAKQAVSFALRHL